MSNLDDSTMDIAPDVDPDIVPRDASHRRLLVDPAVEARLQKFPDYGRRLLETWLKASSRGAEDWKGHVELAQGTIQSLDNMNTEITPDVMESIKTCLCPRGPRETFSSLGMEPELLKTLFGDPNEDSVRMCSGSSMLYLLCSGDMVNILIGTWLLSKITDDDNATLSESLSQEQLRIEAAQRLKDLFTGPYFGPGALWLEKGLHRYIKMYNARIHYGKMIAVLQSSGTGKSRAVAELAKLHWGVTVCFRGLGSKKEPDPHDGYPLGDVLACQFLQTPSIPANLGLGLLKGEEIAAAFIGALFSVMHRTIIVAKDQGPKGGAKKVFDDFWEVPDIRRPEDSPRAKNFGAVQDEAIRLLSSKCHEVLEARNLIPASAPTTTPKTSPRITQGPDTASCPGIEMDVDDADPTDPAVSSTNPVGPTFLAGERKKRVGIVPWVTRLYDILIAAAANDLDQDRQELGLSFLTFIFDECSLLNFSLKSGDDPALGWHKGTPFNHITLLALQRIIKACDGFEFWFLMLDTTSRLHDVYPAADKETARSWRLPGAYTPLPPWPYLPFDVMVPPPKDLPKTPLEALCLDCLKVYGRPLWSTYHDDELMDAAARKLLCEKPELFLDKDLSVPREKTKLQVLALHSTRFILNLCAEGAAGTMAIASVRSHLRILTHYDAATRTLTSEVPSEPILAIAAGKLLLDNKKQYRKAMQHLVNELLLSNNIISLGEKGETLARIILVVNRDATIHNTGGQLFIVNTHSNTLVNTRQKHNRERTLGDNQHYAVRPFRLDSYLQELLYMDKITQGKDTLKSGLDWARGVYLNFTHFVQLDDFVESDLSYEFVVMCWRRGCALQCVHGQAIIDTLLIGYRGELSKPFDPSMFVFVPLQIKNRVDPAGSSLINSITCPFLKHGSKRWKPEYMAILMDMGTSTCFQGIQNDPKRHGQVDVTKGKAVEGKTWAAFDADKEYEAVRINIRGFTPYHSLVEWAPDILELQRSKIKRLTDLSIWNDTLTSTTRVTKGALTLSLKETEDMHEQRQKGAIDGMDDMDGMDGV